MHKNVLRVLTYHRIANLNDTPHLHPGLISATPERFAQQMKFLKNHYPVVNMQQVVEAVKTNQPLPKRAVLITFDDGYRDFAMNAWPIMKRLGLPVTLFVPTAYPDQPQRKFWWDRLYFAFKQNPSVAASLNGEAVGDDLRQTQSRVKSLPHDQAMALVNGLYDSVSTKATTEPTVLNWDELRRLANEGVTLGAHTQTHPILTRVPPQVAREEIAGSQAVLQREIGEAPPVFSYPDGGHNDAVIQILIEEGFSLGFNGPTGVNDLHSCDPFRLRRINITPKSTGAIFKLRLLRWVGEVEKMRLRTRMEEISN